MRYRYYIGLIILLMFVFGCSTTRYVPKNKHLLVGNEVVGVDGKKTFKDPAISVDILESYIGHRPNKKFLGIPFSLWMYNTVDTTKNSGWHRLWSQRLGSPPVIFDSTLMTETSRKMQLHMISSGYLNASVRDSVAYKKQKARVIYTIAPNKPYIITSIDRNIEDMFLRDILADDTLLTLLRVGDNFDINQFQHERERIAAKLQNEGFQSFRSNAINYTVDSAWNDNTVSVKMNLHKKMIGYDPQGNPELINYPIHRISRIVVNTNYVDPASRIADDREIIYDTLLHKGIEIVYSGKLQIKPDILTSAITFSPNSLYDPVAIEKTNSNIRELGFNTLLQFTNVPMPEDELEIVTSPTSGEASTTMLQMECEILCTPNKKQSSSQELEFSATASYLSTALTLGYQNRNLFGGAEIFDISLRGAYEIMHNKNSKNSYEFGGTTSVTLPRFTPVLGLLNSPNISNKSTKIQLTYNMQERPMYHRSVFGGSYGYNWTVRNKNRFTVNVLDVNVVNVPWVDTDYMNNIGNEYLKNSYESQLIAGISGGYFYSSNPKYQESGHTIRFVADLNGNVLSLFNNTMPITTDSDTGERYREIGGLRYAQFARAAFDYSLRQNLGRSIQFAWRFYIGGAIPYGNSSDIPMDRKYFAGGSNSMRGWQIRTLGPGTEIWDESSGLDPFIVGDMKLESNIEFRFRVYDWLNIATFMDAGNVWVNSKSRKSNDANFKLDTFYRQLGLSTGLGIRLDFSFFLVRLDWGLKLHNPNKPKEERWFKDLGFGDSAFHFAVGLPF